MMYAYLKDEDGTVYRYALNPVAAWTPDEWQAELDRLRAERDALQAELNSVPKPPEDWPEEAKRLWWQVNEPMLIDLQWQLNDVINRLTEMEQAVR